MAGTTNPETCECGHDRALHEGGYWACSAEGCGCVMVSGAPDHPTPPAPPRPIVVPITMVPARDLPTPPAPGEAREAVCRWCGEPDAAHLLAENDESSCLLTLRARAAQAERELDAAVEHVSRVVAEREAATQDRDRLAALATAFLDTLDANKPRVSVEEAARRYDALRAALAPRTRSTTDE